MKSTSNYQKVINLAKQLVEINKGFFQDQLTKRELDQFKSDNIELLHDHVCQNAAPCFVLSTGRCGTALLNNLLALHPKLIAAHSPTIELTYHSEFAYLNHEENASICKAHIDAARYEFVRDSFIQQKVYVETNQRITFFAHQLAELYPKATFIHLYRHPYKFISSGVARNWYEAGKLRDEGRISAADKTYWKSLSQEQKIAWLWQETNSFIEKFKNSVNDERVLTVKAEEFFTNPKIAESIFKHIGVEPITETKIQSVIKKPVNKQPKKVEKSAYPEEIHSLMPLMKSYYLAK